MGATAMSAAGDPNNTVGLIQVITIALAGIILLSVAWDEFKRRRK